MQRCCSGGKDGGSGDGSGHGHGVLVAGVAAGDGCARCRNREAPAEPRSEQPSQGRPAGAASQIVRANAASAPTAAVAPSLLLSHQTGLDRHGKCRDERIAPKEADPSAAAGSMNVGGAGALHVALRNDTLVAPAKSHPPPPSSAAAAPIKPAFVPPTTAMKAEKKDDAAPLRPPRSVTFAAAASSSFAVVAAAVAAASRPGGGGSNDDASSVSDYASSSVFTDGLSEEEYEHEHEYDDGHDDDDEPPLDPPEVSVSILGPGSPCDIDMSDPSDRSRLWYAPSDIRSFQSSARTLADWIKRSDAQRTEDRRSCGDQGELLGLLRAYRERFDRRRGGDGAGGAEVGEGLLLAGVSLPPELAGLDADDVSERRGLEFRVSFERQRNKFVALRAVAAYLDRLRREAERRGEALEEYPAGKIAYVSSKVTRWARDLARREGLRDFRDAYPHLVREEEIRAQAALTLPGGGVGVDGDGGDSSSVKFPLHFKKRKCSGLTDDLSSMMSTSCDMSSNRSASPSSSASGTSGAGDDVSLSSMRSYSSIQSSYIKVRPFFEAVAEGEEQQQARRQQQQQQQQAQPQPQAQAPAQQEQPKRRRRLVGSFVKPKLLGGKKKSTSTLSSSR